MSKEGANAPHSRRRTGVKLVLFIPGKFYASCHKARLGGAYRDRTDDLKLAKLALSQLS